MKKFFKLTLIMGITLITLTMSNIANAAENDDDIPILEPGNLLTTTSTTTAPTTKTTTQTTLDLTTKSTTTTSKPTKTTKTTNTTLPHTGIEDNTGAIVAIVVLAIVGISSFVVIKKNSDI